MSVFRNAKKIAKGALPDEEDDSDDALDSGAESGGDDDDSDAGGSDGESGDGSDGEGSDGESGDDSDADADGGGGGGPRAGKRQKTGADAVQAGLRWVRPGRAGEGASSGGESDEDDAAEDAAVDPDAIAFPVQCGLCSKTFFNLEQLQLHMVSKGHAKKQRVYDQGEKKFFRTAAQVAKLKARNQRKREKKLAKKREERGAQGHTWGEHRKPPKSAAQRAADAATAAPKKPKDTRTRAEKRAAARQHTEPAEAPPRKDHVGGGGRKRPGDKDDWNSLPKQQGLRKNKKRERA